MALTLTACQPNRFFSAWVPYWASTSATAPVTDANASLLYSEVSPSFFGTATDTTLRLTGSCSKLAGFVTAARTAGVPVIATVFDSTAAGVMASIVKSPANRAAHVQHLVDLVMKGGVGTCTGPAFDGVDLDYEQFAFADGRASWSATQPAWIAFVSNLADALHARGKLLSVTVPPTWNNPVTQAVSGYWVYDQPHLAPLVDRLRLMVYDWSLSSAGPIAPLSWVDQVITYTSLVAQVPGHRVQLGVPAYGRHWVVQKNAGEVCPEGTAYRESFPITRTAALAATAHRTPTRDASGELTFTWDEVVTGLRTTPPTLPEPSSATTGGSDAAATSGLQPALRLGTSVTCTVHHTVFTPDATNLVQKANRAASAHWSGIVMWALGYETPDVYTALGGVGAQRATGSAVLTSDSPVVTGAVGATASAVALSGVAYHPGFDLPVPVRLTVTNTDTSATASAVTLTARSNRTDLAPSLVAALGAAHGYVATIAGLPSGNYRVCAAASLWGGVPLGAPNSCTTFVVPPAV